MSTLAGRLHAPRGHLPAADVLLRRVRRAWRAGVLLRALLLGAALGLAAALALVALDVTVPLAVGWRRALRWLPPIAACAALAAGAVRAFGKRDPRRFALLVEERLPELQNRLLTALAAPAPESSVGRAFRAEAEARLARADARRAAPLKLRFPVLALAAATLLVAGGTLLFPAAAGEAWTRWRTPERAYASAWREQRAAVVPLLAPPAATPGFDELRWRITPPAYAGLPERDLRGERLPAVLPGSRISLRSRFPDGWETVRAERIGGGALPVRRVGAEWTVAWTQPPDGRGVVLEALAGGTVAARRVVPLLTDPDRPPQLRLELPAEDLVFALPSGRVPVRATARDDHGLGSFRLAWIRSRGSGETFSFAEGGTEWRSRRAVSGGTTGETTLDLAALALQPGDVLHLRAVARDRNTVTGPGESASETRVLRIARPDELDQVNTVIGYPLERDGDPILSQRMLILLTERLRDRAPRLGRGALLREGGEIGVQQGRLRGRVGEQIFTRSTGAMADPDAHLGFEDAGGAAHAEAEAPAAETVGGAEAMLRDADRATGRGTEEELAHRHDEAPVIDVNRTLVTVYNAMWAAERALNGGDPAAALPPQRTALRLLKEMQAGERVFARGRVRVDPVDVRGVRGTGATGEAAPAPRSAEPRVADPTPALAELDAAATLAAPDAAAAFATLAARLLADPAADPRAGALVARAAEAARGGRRGEARDLARRARHLLAGGERGGSAPPVPGAADPAAAEYFRRLGEGGR